MSGCGVLKGSRWPREGLKKRGVGGPAEQEPGVGGVGRGAGSEKWRRGTGWGKDEAIEGFGDKAKRCQDTRVLGERAVPSGGQSEPRP